MSGHISSWLSLVNDDGVTQLIVAIGSLYVLIIQKVIRKVYYSVTSSSLLHNYLLYYTPT